MGRWKNLPRAAVTAPSLRMFQALVWWKVSLPMAGCGVPSSPNHSMCNSKLLFSGTENVYYQDPRP